MSAVRSDYARVVETICLILRLRRVRARSLLARTSAMRVTGPGKRPRSGPTLVDWRRRAAGSERARAQVLRYELRAPEGRACTGARWQGRGSVAGRGRGRCPRPRCWPYPRTSSDGGSIGFGDAIRVWVWHQSLAGGGQGQPGTPAGMLDIAIRTRILRLRRSACATTPHDTLADVVAFTRQMHGGDNAVRVKTSKKCRSQQPFTHRDIITQMS